MKKIRILSLLLAVSMIMLFAFTACSSSPAEGGDDEGAGGNPDSEYAAPENETPAEFRKRYKAAIEEYVGEELSGKLDMSSDAAVAMVKKCVSHMSYSTDFKTDPESTLAKIVGEFNDLLPFKSEGSLIGPDAPATYDEAVTYINAEFEGLIADQAAFDAVLETMKADYDANAQANFDTARRTLWDEYGCTVETNTYFKGE